MKEVYFELSHKEEGYFFFIEKVFEKKSKFQHIVIGDTLLDKRCLILDGVVQFSENDEFLYHEALVQPAVHQLDGVKKALILGGGDGLAAKEFFKHDDVEKVVLVDIDGEVVEACKKFFPNLNKTVFEDPRLELHIEDAFKYIKETKDKFDVVIMDLTDPGQPGEIFYTDSFFKLCKKVMAEKSIFVTHGSCFSAGVDTAARVFVDFKKSFKNADIYRSEYIDSFETTMGFLIGNDSDIVPNFDKIEKRYSKIKNKLRFYSPEIHKLLFYKPKWIQDKIARAEALPKGYVEVQGSAFLPLDKFPLNKK